MSVLQWNINGYYTKYEELRQLLVRDNISVACLQECRFGDQVQKPPRGFSLYSTAGPNAAHGGVVMLVHNSRPQHPLTLQTALQVTAVQVQLNKKYTICSIYIPPADRITQNELDNLFNQLPTPYLVMGDFNARHALWGDSVQNNNGGIVERLLTNRNISILNKNKPTHYHIQTNSYSHVDLSICSSDIVTEFSWEVDDCLHSSDHFPITVAVNDYTPFTHVPKFNYKKADWNLFKRMLNIDRDILDGNDIDETIEQFNQKILQIAEQCIPMSGGKFTLRPVPWWGPEIKQVLARKKQAYRRYIRTRLAVDKIEFNRLRALSRYKIKEAKRNNWKNYVNTINKDTPMKAIWKKVKKIDGKYVAAQQPILQENNIIITDPKAVANKLAHALAAVSEVDRYSPDFITYKTNIERRDINFNEDNISEYNYDFTFRELQIALEKTKNTAEGPDKIHYMLIRNLPEEALMLLLEIYNKIWAENVFPRQWREALIIPFLKPDKNPKQVTSYRPIALTSCVCKLMERMVNTRLVHILERKEIINPMQYGFRKNRSSSDVLVRLETEIRKAFAMRKSVIAVFFDIEKAYDTTWRRGILEALCEYDIKGRMGNFIKQFLKERYFKVRIGTETSERIEQEEGVPQGSVLSVTCFALAINTLPKCVTEGVSASLYVDDFIIYSSSRQLPSAERRLQRAMNNILRWTKGNGFKFSLDKTVVMKFQPSNAVNREPDIYMSGNRLKVVEEKKFLGLIWDKRLTWVKHIKHIKKNCTKRLDLLKIIANRDWGADKVTMMRIYRSVIRSKLDYGCQAYASAKPNILRMLDAVHHAGIRLSLGAFRSSPVQSMYVESSEPSLSSRRDIVGLQHYARLLRLPTSPAGSVVLDNSDVYNAEHRNLQRPFGVRMRELMRELNIENVHVLEVQEGLAPWLIQRGNSPCTYMSKYSKKNISSQAIIYMFAHHMEDHSDSMPVYTDGSKTDTGVGCAAVFPTRSIAVTLPKIATIFTAELEAIRAAIKEIINTRNRNFTIYSDSLSAIQAINNFNHQSPMIMEIQKDMVQCTNDHKNITLCWVPSHTGIVGNDKADEEAKRAAAGNEAGEYPLPHTDYYPVFRKAVKERWQREWDQQGYNKLHNIRPSISKWYTSSNKSRKKETVLSRLRIGHTRLTHGFLMAGGYQTYCEDCIVPLTVEHILIECPEYSQHRRLLRQTGEALTIARVLGDNPQAVDRLFEFLIQCNILHKI